MISQKYIFLDRDGVIIKDKSHQYKIADMEFLPSAIVGLQQMQGLDYKFIVATNQSGIARKLYTENDVILFNNELKKRLKKHGIDILAFYFCPHHPDFTGECRCRKPKPELVEQAVKDFGMNPSHCIFIGDKDSDTLVGKYFGGKTFLINNNQYPVTVKSDYTVTNLKEAAELLHSIK